MNFKENKLDLRQLEQSILSNEHFDKQIIQYVAARTSNEQVLRKIDEIYIGNSAMNYIYISAAKLYIAQAVAGNQYTPLGILKRYIKWAWLTGVSIGKTAYQTKKLKR